MKNPDREARGKKLAEIGSTTAKRVFIVEDHPILRESLVRVVSREKDLTVCGEASAADRALNAIGQAKPDLVLVDITLPDKSGLELVEELRAEDRKIKLLVVSMHDAARYAARALQAGARAATSGNRARGTALPTTTGASLLTYLGRALCFLSCSFSGAASCDLGARSTPARHICSASSSFLFFCRISP